MLSTTKRIEGSARVRRTFQDFLDLSCDGETTLSEVANRESDYEELNNDIRLARDLIGVVVSDVWNAKGARRVKMS